MYVDPLVFIPVERWDEFKSVFKIDWPRSISGFTLLDTEEHLMNSGFDYGFKVYCPFGNVKNGLVALNVKNTLYEVIIQCPNDAIKEFEEALMNTKVIDWNKCNEVPFTSKHLVDCLKRLSLVKNCNLKEIVLTEMFVLDTQSPLFDVGLEPPFSIKKLSLEYIQLINRTWPTNYPCSEWYFELLTKAERGYGLFKDTELVAWIYIRETGALGHLYTVESHRRKGYGELILKYVSNILIEKNEYVYMFCDVGNWNAANLYHKLGFKVVCETDWFYFDHPYINRI